MVEIKVPVISTEGKVGYVVRWYKNDTAMRENVRQCWKKRQFWL